MAEIEIADSDELAVVDDRYAGLAKYKWRFDKDGYVMRKAKGRRIYLHHVILPGIAGTDMVRDHINRNKLDNRCSNLRWLTRAQSAQNKNPYVRKHRLGLRGVTPVGDKYRATVTVDGFIHRLGNYATAVEAAHAAAAARAILMPFSPQ